MSLNRVISTLGRLAANFETPQLSDDVALDAAGQRMNFARDRGFTAWQGLEGLLSDMRQQLESDTVDTDTLSQQYAIVRKDIERFMQAMDRALK